MREPDSAAAEESRTNSVFIRRRAIVTSLLTPVMSRAGDSPAAGAYHGRNRSSSVSSGPPGGLTMGLQMSPAGMQRGLPPLSLSVSPLGTGRVATGGDSVVQETNDRLRG